MFIEFEFCNNKLLIHLVYPIMRQIQKNVTQKGCPLLYTEFMNFLSYFSAGLIYLIVLYRSRKIKNKNIINNNENISILTPTKIENLFYLNYQNITKKRILKKKLSIFFLALLNFIALLIENVSKNLGFFESDFKGSFDILITIFFYVIF